MADPKFGWMRFGGAARALAMTGDTGRLTSHLWFCRGSRAAAIAYLIVVGAQVDCKSFKPVDEHGSGGVGASSATGATSSAVANSGGGGPGGASSAGGIGGSGGSAGPTCPGEQPGCVNEWIPSGTLSSIGGIVGYNGALYVAANYAIYRIAFGTTTPMVIAGSPGNSGLKDAAGSDARFGTIAGLAVHQGKGWLLVVDAGNCAIRMVDLGGVSHGTGTVTPYPTPPLCGTLSDGPASMALLMSPRAIELDQASPHQYAYFTDASAVRRLTLSNGSVSSVSGSKSPNANFGQPQALLGSQLNADVLTVADAGHSVLKTIDLAANPPNSPAKVFLSCGKTPGNQDGTCDSGALFQAPTGLAIDSPSSPTKLFVSDSVNHNIRSVSLKVPATVTTLAGGFSMHAVGLGAKAGIVKPSWLAYRVGPPPELYIVENGEQIRRMVLP